MARPARAVSATTRSCGNGEESSAVPVEPNIARFAGVSARFTSIPSAASTVIPASMHRRRLVIADERPGRLPEQVLHHVRRDQAAASP